MSQHGTSLHEYSDGQIAAVNAVITNSLPLALKRFDREDVLFALTTQRSRLPQTMLEVFQRLLIGRTGATVRAQANPKQLVRNPPSTAAFTSIQNQLSSASAEVVGLFDPKELLPKMRTGGQDLSVLLDFALDHLITAVEFGGMLYMPPIVRGRIGKVEAPEYFQLVEDVRSFFFSGNIEDYDLFVPAENGPLLYEGFMSSVKARRAIASFSNAPDLYLRRYQFPSEWQEGYSLVFPATVWKHQRDGGDTTEHIARFTYNSPKWVVEFELLERDVSPFTEYDAVLAPKI